MSERQEGVRIRSAFGYFAISPEALLEDERVSDRAYRLWGRIYRKADRERFEARLTRREMAGWLGVSMDTLDRAIENLEQTGWMRVDRDLEPLGQRSMPSLYTLLNAAAQEEVAAPMPMEGGTVAPQVGVTGAPQEGVTRAAHALESNQDPESPPTPRGAEADPPWYGPTVGGVVATPAERDLADAILGEFNRQAGTSYSRTADYRRLVVTRIREHPDLTLDQHTLMIEAVLAHPWWKDEPPTPRVVYGHSRIEQAREYLIAAERTATTTRARAQEIEQSMADRSTRHEAELEASRTPAARAAARAALASVRGGRP